MSEEKLTRENLQTAEAILSLGLVVVKELSSSGITVVFINENGEVERCTAFEMYLDLTSQDKALEALIEVGYSDEQLLVYLKGRKARGKLSGADL